MLELMLYSIIVLTCLALIAASAAAIAAIWKEYTDYNPSWIDLVLTIAATTMLIVIIIILIYGGVWLCELVCTLQS